MMPRHGLSEVALTQIVDVLMRFPGVEKAVLFGSRAKGVHRTGSDIDLALVGTELDWRVIGQIHAALEDLPLPYRFSLIRYDNTTDAEVAAHIDRVGLPLFQRQHGAEPLQKA